ncbi:MAG: hypothetical protein ACYS3S_10970 [Planctomycetota bacterium]
MTRHAIPYSYVSNGIVRGPSWGGSSQGVVGGGEILQVTDGYAANCLYNHPNFPDGFLRTSAHQLAQYLITYLNGGSLNGTHILAEESIQQMLRPLNVEMRSNGIEFGQSLVWFELDVVWGHSGGDPGINTLLSFKPFSGDGVVVRNESDIECVFQCHLLRIISRQSRTQPLVRCGPASEETSNKDQRREDEGLIHPTFPI